jgi:hypothetical protein
VTGGSDDVEARGGRIRLFTLAEANALLESLIPLLSELAEGKRGLDAVHEALLRITPQERTNGHRLEVVGLEHQMERLVDRLAQGIRDIEAMGIAIKDIEEGIIDFPSLFRGRVIYLCFRLGEERIGFWHEITTGFSGRRPIAEIEPS